MVDPPCIEFFDNLHQRWPVFPPYMSRRKIWLPCAIAERVFVERIEVAFVPMSVIVPGDLTDWWSIEHGLVAILDTPKLTCCIDFQHFLDMKNKTAFAEGRPTKHHAITADHVEFEVVIFYEIPSQFIHAFVMDGYVVMKILPAVPI